MIFNKKKILFFIYIFTFLLQLYCTAANGNRAVFFTKKRIIATSLLLSTGIGSLIAYKKNDKFKKAVDKKKQEAKDILIEKVICPILIKWETVKDEGLSKKDIFYLSVALIGSAWTIKKIYNKWKQPSN